MPLQTIPAMGYTDRTHFFPARPRMTTTNTDITSQPGDPPRLRLEASDGVTLVAFPRRKIDGVAVRELYEAAATMSHERDPKLLVNFDGVVLVSSGVMGILVTIQKLFRHVGGQLHIVSPDAMVIQQFEVANLHLLLKLFTDCDTAKKTFK
jgi:anti-anti-sigma factor